ncbi:MAG: glycerophosphodiester phosphodiesterase [Candidatus Promineifilaceae bacterium]
MKRSHPVLRRISIFLGLLILAYLVVVAGVHLMADPVPDHAVFENFDTTPLVIGHADDTGNGLWPGNTMPFLEGIAGLGVDMLEMDTNMTKDGRIILMHDDTVDRTTNGEGRISDLTLAEIQSLEVGVNWSQDDGQTFPYQGQGVQVPTLDEVFERFPDYPMVIEIKQAEPDMTEPFCNLIREYNMEDKVIVASFSDEAIHTFRQRCPEVATAPASDEVRNFVLLNFVFLSEILNPTYQAFQVPVKSSGIPVINGRFVRAAHNRNIQVQVWTINDTAEMQHLIDLGVDGIMTDRPDLLMELLGR